jgi:CBS domain-containing protein
MQSKVKTLPCETSIAEAVVSLADAHVSGMPVVDGSGRMVGVVSTSDVLMAEAEGPHRRQPYDTAVQDIMTPRPFTVAPDDDVREAARQMLYADVHRLFVTEGDRLIGVISTTDVVRAVANGSL